MNKIILFRTTRDVILADRLCQDANLPAMVKPVPVRIASMCGMCLEIDLLEMVRFEKLMEQHSLEIKIYDIG